MDDRKTYGVLWQHKYYPGEWMLYSIWFESFETARETLEKVAHNPRCSMVKVVERTESFKDVVRREGE